MADGRILVVGAGPAGLSAAITLAEAGEDVMVVDQAPRIGGAVYAQFRGDFSRLRPESSHIKAWRVITSKVSRHKSRIDIRCSTRFIGLDYRGVALVAGPTPDSGAMFEPRAVIMATGARELVRPRPGWLNPATTTIGTLQINLKTTGLLPAGRIVLAGSGPLLYAVGAQICRAGNPPIAIIEAARPLKHPSRALRLPFSIMKESAGYMATLAISRTALHFGSQLARIKEENGELHLTISRNGVENTIVADHLGLHDGLASNDYGITASEKLPVISAGDCREVLGRTAAVKDGTRAALNALTQLGRTVSPDRSIFMKTEETAAKAVGALFTHAKASLPDPLPGDTIICRCENRSVADLQRAIRHDLPGGNPTARMTRLTGRFGMGPCQGRFCMDWVAEFSDEKIGFEETRGCRWPIRPVSVADILGARNTDETSTSEKLESIT